MQIKKFILPVIGMIFLLTGCATKQPQNEAGYLKNIDYIVKKEKEKRVKEELNTKSYHFMIKPIVESKQDDSKVVVDMGKILKVWVSPYVVRGTLIAAHSIYTWVVPPRFIPGESVGRGSYTDASLITPNGNYPIVYRPDEVYNTKAHFTNKELKEYVNKKYEAERHPEKVWKKVDKQNSKYDRLIKEYLKSKEKGNK
jgi:hypothetical protein